VGLLRSIFTFLVFLIFNSVSAQVKAYFAPALFYSPEQGAYIETNLTLVGKSIGRKKSDRGFINSVNITLRILKDSALVKAEKYNLSGPAFADSSKAPNFIDCHRYPLPNGDYEIEVTLSDNNDTKKKSVTLRSPVSVDFQAGRIECSNIQPVESFKKAEKTGPLTKSGYDLIPYNSAMYPESSDQLAFYFETYNAETVLGAKKPLVLQWYLENADNNTRLSSYGSFQKEEARPVNVLLAKADISTLGSGNYAVVVELKDGQNITQKTERFFFRRVNRTVDLVTLQKMDISELTGAFVGNTNNIDTLKMYVECLWPIAGREDKEKIVDETVKKDPESMKHFVVDFWRRRAADTANPVQMWGRYYRQVQQVMVLFKCGKQKGYYTDRGRVFLQYGFPNQRSEQPNESNTFPYEIWQYYRITDGTNGNFYSNRKFVFVNKTLADDCYSLVHSDMPGELNNSRWQYEVTRRNYNGYQNPDQTTPGQTEDNQMKAIYQNPR
jgi:GWxTD domain-containing protein